MRVASIGAALFIAGFAAAGPQSVHVPVLPSILPPAFSDFVFIGRDADGFPFYTRNGVPQDQALGDAGVLMFEGYSDLGEPIWSWLMAQPNGPMAPANGDPTVSAGNTRSLRAQSVLIGDVFVTDAQALYATALTEARKRGLR